MENEKIKQLMKESDKNTEEAKELLRVLADNKQMVLLFKYLENGFNSINNRLDAEKKLLDNKENMQKEINAVDKKYDLDVRKIEEEKTKKLKDLESLKFETERKARVLNFKKKIIAIIVLFIFAFATIGWQFALAITFLAIFLVFLFSLYF
jgi:hypothetical protein